MYGIQIIRLNLIFRLFQNAHNRGEEEDIMCTYTVEEGWGRGRRVRRVRRYYPNFRAIRDATPSSASLFLSLSLSLLADEDAVADPETDASAVVY